MARVSVVVATYRGAYLREALSSIEEQTFADFEVLVLDDACSAECKSIVRQFDERFRYIGNSPRLGVARNHRRGLRLAHGEFTAILNHDDLWDRNFLAQLVEEADANPSAVAFFSRTLVANSAGQFDQDRTSRAWRVWRQESLPDGLITNWFARTGRLGFPLVASSILRTAACRDIWIPRVVGGAYDLWLGYRLVRQGPVYHVPHARGFWREHGANLTNDRSFRRGFELIFIDAVAAVDLKLPVGMRRRSLSRLPRSFGRLGRALLPARRRGSIGS